MADILEDHIARVRTSLLTGYSLDNRAEWIQKHTFLRGEPFSFVGHEFQLKIVNLTCEEALVRKCSQIGLSRLACTIGRVLVARRRQGMPDGHSRSINSGIHSSFDPVS